MNDTKRTPPLIIFARTNKEADNYAMGHLGLNRSEYRYISSPEYLKGYPQDSFHVKLYRWDENKNPLEMDEIDMLLRVYNILPNSSLQKSIDERKDL